VPYRAGVMVVVVSTRATVSVGSSSLLSGSGSHKTSAKDKDVNFILRFYYSFPYALFFLCAFNEGFLVGLYLLKFT
jgi:hypothetical protein